MITRFTCVRTLVTDLNSVYRAILELISSSKILPLNKYWNLSIVRQYSVLKLINSSTIFPLNTIFELINSLNIFLHLNKILAFIYSSAIHPLNTMRFPHWMFVLQILKSFLKSSIFFF